MASLSLPRVLTQRRGGPIEVERENFWKAQTTSITKAINNQENPVKEKHVRSAIIGTYHERGATTFWAVVATLPLQGNPIVCWKFCHTLHKLLREGHPTVIGESLQYRPRIAELGKYWGYLKESFGKLISCYCRLLANRLEFHSKNPKFPGNLQLNDEQLESIGEMDINNFFQITVEMFDYMDEILALQMAVFGSLEMGRANSMTSSGQCRLAPLIPCIQDSSHLYDYLVKLLFKLHSSLPPDILIGHRDRFYKQFKVLREFYRSASVLQYFKHLIQIPLLPEEPPNFLVKSDLSSHVSPVVILPPQEDEIPDNDSMEFSLADTKTANLLDIEPTNGTVSPDHSEKDILIEQLRREIEELKYEIQRIKVEDQRIIAEFQRQSTSLDAYIRELQQQLADKQTELEVLQLKAVAAAENSEAAVKLIEAEKKSKANEEKFFKMKDVYNKLREEHIVLLRGKADVEKQLGSAKQVERTKTEIEEQLQKMTVEKVTMEQLMHQNAQKAAKEMTEVLQERDELQREKLALQEKLQLLLHEKSHVEQTMQQNMETSKEKVAQLVKEKDELGDSNKEFDELLFQAIDEKYVADQEMQAKEEEHARQVESLTKERNESQSVIVDLEARLANVSYEKCTTELNMLQNSETLQQQIDELLHDKQSLEDQVRDLEEQITQLTTDKADLQHTVADLTEQISKLESQMTDSKKKTEDYKEKLAIETADYQFALLVGCIEEAESMVQNGLNEINNPMTATLSCSPEYLLTVSTPLPELLDRLQAQHSSFNKNPKDFEVLLKSVASLSHFLSQLLLHGKATANILPDVEQGDKLTEACRTAGIDTLQLLASMKVKGLEPQVSPNANKVRSDVQVVRKITEALIASQAAKVEDKIEDLVDKELADMDRAIEEAASRIADILEKSRADNSGIKLEVSEKILDTCTALMQSIKVLVRRSKDLQKEILAQGKGSASVKEFYKRNHQWTEGLISAAKAVGIGAQFLVDAADKVVSGQSKFETLVAASQEIAASTAQLVVASKVKANPSSDNLRALSTASNGVRGCTATVVATVKDCAQMMEDSDVMDFGNLTLHQAKRLEMESHVRVLELESNLEKERVKFSALRKKHYALAGPGEGWEEGDGDSAAK